MIVERASPPLHELSDTTQETVKLSLHVEDAVIGVVAIESPQVVGTRGDIGVTAPLYCTAVGKAILAFLDAPDQEAFLARVPLRAFTAKTITDPRRLAHELWCGPSWPGSVPEFRHRRLGETPSVSTDRTIQ